MKLGFLAPPILIAAVALGPAPALAQDQAINSPNQITIRVCNNTSNNARVALSYQPSGQAQFYNEGWYAVQTQSCRDLVTTGNGYFYAYAEVENNDARSWAGDFPLCVEYPGPYAFWSNDGAACGSGQEVRNFVSMRAEVWGAYTWSLD